MSGEVRVAARNAVKLGASLTATWGVALFVRLLLPRYLGPQDFGIYAFAEGFTAMSLGFLSFGVEPYIQKEIPVRPHHASDFFGGVMVVRAVLTVAILVALQAILQLTGRPSEVQRVVFVFGLGFAVFNLNSSLAAILQANTTVGGLAVVNVVGKLLWGAWLGTGIVLHAPLEALAAGFLVAETLRAASLFVLARREVNLALLVDMGAVRAVLWSSLPFYANSIAIAAGSRLDVTLLGFLTGDNEAVGWYGAASNLAGLVFLLAPLMNSVLLPLLSRAHARSEESFWDLMHRAAEGLIAVGTPIVVTLALGAPFWMSLLFGPSYRPAGLSLAAIAPHFVLTYLSVLCSIALIVLGRGWTLTSISISSVLAHPLLAVVLVPTGARLLGTGGAGLGSGLAAVGTELIAVTLLIWRLGGRALDRQVIRTAVAAIAGVAAAAAVNFALPTALGATRLLAALPVYFAVAGFAGGIRVRRYAELVREVLPQRWRRGA